MNPLVNAGAITTTSMVKGSERRRGVEEHHATTHEAFAGRKLKVNEEVYKSEAATNQRNQAIGELMYAYGRIKANPKQAVDIYTQAVLDLGQRERPRDDGGDARERRQESGHRRAVIDARHVPGILAVMATAGLYDDSGKWLFWTGLPGKSGVGGGLIAVSPGKFGIAVISPPLDKAGNSVRGQRAIADISNALGGNPYAVQAAVTRHADDMRMRSRDRHRRRDGRGGPGAR